MANSGAINPLPSLLHASATDAGNARMRAAGRKAWSRGDYNECARTIHRLIDACYARPWDLPGDEWRYIRVNVARELEKRGLFTLDSDFAEICTIIDLNVPPPRELWPHVGEAA